MIALSLATLAGSIVYPTYPNYDSYYSLLWGRELLELQKPSFETYYAPTQHPLAVAFGGLLSLLGRGADRIMVLCTLASFVLLCAGLYRFARLLFTPLVGLAAGAILCTRFDFPFLAARAYIDIPYLALVIWAAVLELQRPWRGGWVWALLLGAALLRPEAWLLLGLYGAWHAYGAWRREHSITAGAVALARAAAISAIAPIIWCGTDLWVTGDPFFSLTHTSAFAEELGRTKGASQIPGAMRSFFFDLTKVPVLFAGIVGFLLALWFVPRRALLPAVLWLIGSGTFVLIGMAGLSVIDRYLLVPALMVMVFAAVTVAGWTMLRPGLLRRSWATLAVLGVLGGVVFTYLNVNTHALTSELERRGTSHRALVELLDRDGVRDLCRPITTPNHKLVPEVRWVAGLADGQVRARAEATGATDAQRTIDEIRAEQAAGTLSPRKARQRVKSQRARVVAAEQLRRDGTALYVVDRGTISKQAIVDDRDDVFNNIPVFIDRRELPDYRRTAFNEFYSVYARCPAGR